MLHSLSMVAMASLFSPLSAQHLSFYSKVLFLYRKKREKPCVNMSSNLISRTRTAAKSRTEGKCPQGNNSCGEQRGCLRKIAHRYIYPLAVTLPSHNSLIDLAKQSPTVLAACPQQSSSLPKAELSPREKRFPLSTENTLH